MQWQLLNKISPEKVFIFVGNAEASAALPAGEPICFVMNGTRDGFDVVKAVTGTATKATSLFAGVPIKEIASSGKGTTQVFGFIENLLYTQLSRAASTDSYASGVAVAIGELLQVSTAPNGFLRSGAGAVSAFLPFAVACETKASAASSASTTSDTSTRVTLSLKAFLRAV